MYEYHDFKLLEEVVFVKTLNCKKLFTKSSAKIVTTKPGNLFVKLVFNSSYVFVLKNNENH